MQSVLFVVVLCTSLVALAEKSDPIKCVQCNTKTEGEAWCGDTDDESQKASYSEQKKKHSYACNKPPQGMASDTKAVGCRKILQYVVDESVEKDVRVMRECAYTGENVEGQKRTGNLGIRMYFYQCDKEDNCNGAGIVTASILLTLITVGHWLM